ncbi:MAG TPA: DHHA1 domain-containing protein [Methanoregula sp.]|nr:DHHA1 domain-containing protein [Methanoregula sp.]
MPLESIAETVAEQIRRQEFVEVYAHHDADGIAAGSILCHAMLRAGIRFRMRARQEVIPVELKEDGAHLLCDLGAGMADLPNDTMVVDHHLPKFEGVFHANPRLAGIDGDRELSAAGMAYIVAQKMGDNRDLAGLVIPGIISDGQEITGKNLEIFNDGVAEGIIIPDRGITLPGRDMAERWYMATSPYLDGISGAEQLISDILGQARDQAKGENTIRLDTLLSRVVLEAAPNTTLAGLHAIYGDTCHLQREVIDDAHTLAAVLDACGKTGHGDIGAALCLRSSHYLDRAWEIARQHRTNLIGAIRNIEPLKGSAIVYKVQDVTLTSDVADILTRDLLNMWPVLVYADAGDSCKISARCPAGIPTELGPLVSTLAAECGGNGGGHVRRAGATIPCGKMGMFTKGWQEAFAA